MRPAALSIGSSSSTEEFQLCKPVHHTRQKRQSPCSTSPQNGSVLVVGALYFLGSRLVSHLASNGVPVEAVADYKDVLISNHGLAWYRAEMLHLHHGISVKLANLTNRAQVEHLLAERQQVLSRLVFVPPRWNGEIQTKNSNKYSNFDKIMSDSLIHFVTILEVVKDVSPCTHVVLLIEEGASSTNSHSPNPSMARQWISTFELMLSTYRYFYRLSIRLFRVHSVFGPWDDSILEKYLEEGSREPRNMEDNCWYVDDAMTILLRDLLSARKCGLVQLEDCKFRSKEEHVQQAENIDRSWTWAQSFAEEKYNKRKHKTKLKNDVVFTSYFTSAEDYQRKRYKSANDFRYMKDFYFSLKEMKMKAVVFHDGLDQGFQHRVHSYYTNVTFEKVDSLHGRTTNDARFYAYYKYLLEHSDITKVLLTDISDVVFQRDPFELMSVVGDWLYVGTDIDIFPTMASMPWIKTRLGSCFGNFTVEEGGELHKLMKMETVYNAGTIGGSRERVLSALAVIVTYLDTTPPKLNCNMPAVNYAMHKHFFDVIFTGFPLNSRFFRWQSSPKGVYIIHK